ncbi:L,D-transpeptidase family protein [Faecalispora anaeroviscerum]|uniref:L,D-transpeptidase family protein n=1 Tax=Faecalispora anaeroviscerum TaxID=2991836 RepID=UPI0024BABF18|nr:L,D-transpeptidase family protein [Faecalispora anaeroviscerum]
MDSLNIRLSAGQDKAVVFSVSKGTALSILGESDGDWVKVKAQDGRTGWCNKNYLTIMPAETADVSNVTEEQAAFPAFAQVSFAKASQPLTVYVSLKDQNVTVVDAKNLVVQVFPCSTGMEGYETPSGTYAITNRGESFYNKSLKEGAYYWTQFYGNYLFHSLPFDENRQMVKGEAEKLGQPASHGCVRLSMENAKWFYDNIKEDTKVVIQ